MKEKIKSRSYQIYQDELGEVVMITYEDRQPVSVERRPLLIIPDMLNIAHHGYEEEDSLVGLDPVNKVAQIDVHIEQYGAWSDLTLYPADMSREYTTAIGMPEDLQDEDEITLDITLYGEETNPEVIWNAMRDEKLRNVLGMSRSEAHCYNIHDVAVIMEDRKTKDEALKALDKGTAVINITEEPWEKWYEKDYEMSLEEIKGGQSWSLRYVEYKGNEYVIDYMQ